LETWAFLGIGLCFLRGFGLGRGGYGRYGWRSSSFFNNQARFGTGQKNKKFGLILDGDSGNGIMGFCAGSWMDGYSMTRSGLPFSIDMAFNGVGYALDGILAWIPMASGFGVSPLE